MNLFHCKLSLLILAFALNCIAAPVHLVDEAPVSIKQVAPGLFLVDFGKVAFGNIQLVPPTNADSRITVHFGEDFRDGRINRKPPGSVRYASAPFHLQGSKPIVAAPAADPRNTQVKSPGTPPAILTPSEWGVVLPFRWVEIEGWPGELLPRNILRKSAFSSTWDDKAAAFKCSDETLNRIWDLCRYSIKATTFAGTYVDGDRERIPYEADAYLNQLSHYATDRDVQMARDTFDHLIKHPTWPTEWSFHMIFMAHADYRHTGDTQWLSSHYEVLKPKLLLGRAREDGLLVSNATQIKKGDIVDWPLAERDGYVFKPVNTVVNAFHIRALGMMAEMASALGKDKEATEYSAMATKASAAFQRLLFDPAKGAYRDGEGTDHLSQHASLFPLAFGLIPSGQVQAVLKHVEKRGMACSVYAAQYLMDALFSNGGGVRALELMNAASDRSWKHMVESGTTLTWEAWDQKYKPNQDWNHAWGAAPANLLPRYILGAESLTPGWKQARIRPQTGKLSFAKGKVPTPSGPIEVEWKNGTSFEMKLGLPKGMTAKLDLPASTSSKGVTLNGKPAAAKLAGDRWLVDEMVSGDVMIKVD
ncbi:MAG: alpha-L-rhamnosidase [Verrucomicrobiales bacterium VVV1]|nr:MAG: alpha-L-rhamnosidase [Verrucomicrobiales bacterium VVV1]